jgi:hypothetical protein
MIYVRETLKKNIVASSLVDDSGILELIIVNVSNVQKNLL